MLMVRQVEGNQHIGREQLFSNVDGYYSLCYSNPRGNIRSFFDVCSAGTRLDTPVAQFRIKSRTEVQINWYKLTANAVIAAIGE